jgi:VacB/RNase II family 3'-5' exoribonuclease
VTYDLTNLARESMRAKGFDPDFPAAAVAQAEAVTLRRDPKTRDLRALLWSSIDNDSSKDLDQVEFAEPAPNGRIRVLIGIADVDAAVAKSTPIDLHAAEQTVSVYTHARVFSMIPERLSTGLTSLNEGEERLAIVTDLLVNSDGTLAQIELYPAQVLNRAKLTYNAVGAWLEGRGAAPAAIAASKDLERQVKLQDEAATALRQARDRRGALRFERSEAEIVMQDGQVKSFTASRKNRAGELIEDFMLAANQAMARSLREKGVWSIRRVVRAPRRWDRIVALAQQAGEALPGQPDVLALSRFLEAQRLSKPATFADLSLSVLKLMGPGEYAVEPPTDTEPDHFSLAALDYTHSTAPNRRFADVVTQRILKAALNGAPPPYSETELDAIARNCTFKEDQARKVERLMDKRIAAMALADRVGARFDAVVTGVTPKGTFVRVTDPPAEGLLREGEAGVDVGDRLAVKLLKVDVRLGFVDFGRV